MRDLVEAAIYHNFASGKPSMTERDLEMATIAVGNPNELANVFAKQGDAPPEAAGGKAASDPVKVAFAKLPSAIRDLKKEVISLAQQEKLPLMTVAKADPIELAASDAKHTDVLIAQAICKGLTLPPQANEPWRWGDKWAGVLEHGESVEGFVKGLHKACEAGGAPMVNLRAKLTGHRQTALRALQLLVRSLGTIDMRDNRVTDAEMAELHPGLDASTKLQKLMVGGNRLSAGGLCALAQAVSKVDSRVVELDLSRNRMYEAAEGAEMGAIAALHTKVGSLVLHGNRINDGIGVRLCEAFRPAPEGVKPTLTKLDLSRNALGVAFADALPKLLAHCPSLATLDISRNDFGVAGGRAIADALASTTSLKTLDLTATNLCNCTPLKPTAARGEWSVAAVQKLSEALMEASVAEVILASNGLCGMWAENICGETVTRGTYNADAVDCLVAMFDKERISIKRDGIKFEDGNFLRTSDAERLHAAVKLNSTKVMKKESTNLAANLVKDIDDAPKDDGKKAADAPGSPGAKAAAEESQAIALEEIVLPGQTNLAKMKAMKNKDRVTEVSVIKELGGAADAEGAEGEGEAETAQVANWRAARDAELKAEEAHEESKAKQEKRAVEAQNKKKAEDDLAILQAGHEAPKKGGDKPNLKKAKSSKDVKGDGPSKKGDSKSSGSGLTPRTNKNKDSGGGTGLTPRTNKSDAPSAAAVEETKAAAAPPTKSGYGQQTGKGKKKKVVEQVVEEAPNPFAGAPLMISMSNLVARTEVSTSSPQVPFGAKIAAGALMRVAQTEEIRDNSRGKMQVEHRMYVALDGDTEALGWVTGISKDEVEHLKLASAGFPLMQAVKVLNCREGKENDSKKLDDVPKHTLVRVMEQCVMPDGTEKALVCPNTPVADPFGWVVCKKEGQDVSNIQPAPVLQISFDLKVHTATSLSKALSRPKDAPRRKKDAGGLPFQPAGRRPITRPEDGPSASRHRLVDKPASGVLIFNCSAAQFEVTSWNGDQPFEKLSGESSFDLISKTSRKRLGRVALAKELGQPFLERVEFPDDWLIAEEHGVIHDGWQGNGIIDLELTWNKAVATIRVWPWLAYGCSIGARFLIRKMGSAEGQCATVQRILGDDRVVCRVDGYSKADGVKGETIVDLQPSTVVRTTAVGYPRDTKVLVLHNGKLVDAQVLTWLGSNEFMEGSRHMINVKPQGEKTGCHAWYDLNMFNHVVTDADMSAAMFEETRSRYCKLLTATEDKVEDAITGNNLQIKDQLIFMEAMNVANGCNPPDYMSVSEVPLMINLLLAPSPKRSNGTHVAQPVLCRAGPGTGKTWMVKQSLFLLAERLGGDQQSEGIRLVPVVVYVQRIVRLLNELGDDPSELLSDPNGLMRWYISNQFADKKEERNMLLQAYEMRAICILVDGVDEAAGMRELVEAFVHYELVTSGNRLVVTSRPEGVDLEDYKTRFVVMNLKELSQEQQRNVIQMQLQGNAFFEHLVNIAECRKELDAAYAVLFKSEALKNEIEGIEFDPHAAHKAEEEAAAAAAEAEEANKKDAEEGGDKKDADKKAAEAEAAAEANRRASVVGGGPAEPSGDKHTVQPMVRRRLALDTQQDLMAWMQSINIKERLRSQFLEALNQKVVRPTKAYSSLLDQLDTEIRLLPSPCTRAALESSIATLEQAQPNKEFDKDLLESLVQLGLQRKLPVTGGRRGAKAAPIPALGLWYQVLQHTDEKYLQVERYQPVLMYILGTLAAATNIREFALQVDDATGRPIPGTEKSQPPLEFRDPVDLWLHSTYAGATEPAERPPEAWIATATMKCETGEQCLQLIRRLVSGIEVEVGAEAAYFVMLDLKNTFNNEKYHPTHLRNASCHMLLTFRGVSVAVNVRVEHQELLRTYVTQNYSIHNDYFWHRMLNLSEDLYESKFEMLLIFLVEAIGVPVLLSLLLLTYSNTTGGDVIDLDELPEGRLQLYKLGIMSGIKKRLLITLQAAAATHTADKNDKSGAAEEEAAAAENRPKRERRKGALEQSLGASAGPATGGGPTQEVKVTKHATNEPVLDLNSILRGKKVRVVTGADDVAEAYSLVVRVLDKSKQAGFDLRSGIVAVVPKSHTMHAIVTALVEYVLAPLGMTEASLFEIGKKMLRHVAVDNQENGRREFTSKNVACALGASPEELGLWSRLDLDYDHGVALTATLAKQSDKAPAQYQFKHLSFQEGLYAEHLLLLVTSLTPPNGNGWPGWASDKTAAEFLNNRYMNNTCRIAAGHLGALLAKQRPEWDFRQHPLTPNGRMALWYVTDDNDQVNAINAANNDVGSEDVPGLSKTITTCSNLQRLDLSDNELHKLTVNNSEWIMLCDALGSNTTLTSLNLNNNKLGPSGVRTACRALRGTVGLKRLGFSFNEPGTEHALADLLRLHPALESVELVEALDRHLPSRSKDDIGRALMDNKAKALGFLHCDTFVLGEETTSLVWPKEASTSDAVLLAGVLVTNTVLTTFNIAGGAILANTARSALGEALLNNPNSRVAFCNDFGLQPKVDTCEFDLSKTELKDVEPFRLLAGCLRGNRTLTHVTLRQLRMEQIETLALALRGNSTLAQLDIIHTTRLGGESIVRLPVPELNGSRIQGEGGTGARVDMSKTCIEGAIGRVACAMIGTLTTANTTLQCLDLSNTGLGLAVGTEGEGGHIVFRPMCESKECPLNELVLNNIQLNDKAGAKLFSSLAAGLGKGDSGYEKIESLSVANNDLGKGSAAALKQLLWGERAPCKLKSLDLSGNAGLDGYDTALAIKRNESLTSVDFRNIPSANTEEIYSFLGSFLLQEECQCRLGLLSCDAFQVVAGQTELVLKPPAPDEAAEGGTGEGGASANKAGVMSLLAGVLKFNSSLLSVQLADVGLDDASGAFIATALLENKTLETLDVSSNPLGSTGITDIARAVRDHPALKALKVDGSELPISQLRGAKGAEGNIDFTDVGIGSLSGHAIGTIVAHNRTLLNLNLKSNRLGADGVQAVVRGLGDAPLKALDVTRNGLTGAPAEIKELSESICRNLGAIVDLRMDENDLDSPASSLAPLCKLRSLRVLSWEKNRLTEIPPLIGTMLSLRKVLLHSNQLMEIPPSICLLTLLETLDVHKNLLTSLPSGIGQMKGLQKLDLSENKLTELPITICELNDDLQLSVGRNPLEKPSVEQARQGIGAIRRFFGYNRSKGGDDASAEEKIPPTKPIEGAAMEVERPKRPEGASSRHDWAGPGASIVLFNCFGCAVREVEGGSDLNTIPGDDSVDLVAGFNMQVVGRVKEAATPGQALAQRLEFYNEWLPWKNQDIEAHEQPNLLINVRWKVLGSGKNAATLLVNPWLAYGCTVGSRVRTDTGFATIVQIKDDDSCEALRDNVKEGTRADRVDPRPDTVGRTTSPTYKTGQKLLLLHDGVPIDAIVDEWLGIRRGSRHRIRLSSAKNASAKDKKEMLEVDLNELNHAKLLFPTVARYEEARSKYCDALIAGKHSTVRDEATQKDLRVADQRVFIKPFTVKLPAAAPAADAAEAKGGDDDDDDGAAAAEVAQPKAVEEIAPDDQAVSLTSFLDKMISPITSRNAKQLPTLVRTRTRAEHELVFNQSMHILAMELRDPHPRLGPIKLVPIALSIAKVAELLQDEALAKQGARAVIVKAFETDYPGLADMLRQAMDMKAIVFIVEVTSEADFHVFKEGMLEEFKSHRVIIACTGFNADNEPLQVPVGLAEQWNLNVLSSMGLFMNELKISDKMLSLLFTRMQASKKDGSVYSKVVKLHLASSEVARNAMTALQELLRSPDCMLNALDLSFTQVDGWALVQAMKANSSLTALDMYGVPKIDVMYESLTSMLNDSGSKCKVGYLRCEAFDLHEGAVSLVLHEEPVAPVAVKLLAALLKNNRTLHELDLTACDIEKEACTALAEAISSNTTLLTLKMGYNVALDAASKAVLTEAASKREPSLHLDI